MVYVGTFDEKTSFYASGFLFEETLNCVYAVYSFLLNIVIQSLKGVSSECVDK